MNISDLLDCLGISNYSIDWRRQIVYVEPKNKRLVEIAFQAHPEGFNWTVKNLEKGGTDFDNCGRCGVRLYQRC